MSVTEEAGVKAAPGAVEVEAIGAGIVAVLDAVADVAADLSTLLVQVAELRSEVAEVRAEVAPIIEAATQLGPMADKLAAGGLMGLLRPGG
jgi:hypothetical protein